MNSGQHTNLYERNMMGYSTVETLLEDVSKQMASSNLSRYPRGSSAQKTGGSMRVVKPSSASNSPRGSIGLGRRRTVMSDGTYCRRVAIPEQNAMAFDAYTSHDGLQQNSTRSNRPVSWHPSSHLAPQPIYQPSYHTPKYDYSNEFLIFDHTSTPASISGYTSPESSFSHLSIPVNDGYTQQQFPQPDVSSFYPLNTSYAPYQPSAATGVTTQNYAMGTSADVDSSMYSHFDWANFAANGFESSTAPPTPENFLPIQHPDPTFPTEEAIPYHSLSDSEDAGEELIGMGLYDSPEVAKTPSLDPQLDNYRALMMSQLLGSGYRRNAEPTGKGLKLEETWNPPPSDDEEDDDDDDEQDGEGEDDDESTVEAVGNRGEQTSNALIAKNAVATQSNDGLLVTSNIVSNAAQENHGSQGFHRNGWL